MKKLVVKIFLIIGFLFPFAYLNTTHAVSLTPSSANFGLNTSQVIQITASAPSTAQAVNIHLVLTGDMNFTGYTPPPASANWLSLPSTDGNCGGAMYVAKEICVSLSKTGGLDITNGESLGYFTVQTSSSVGTAIIDRGTFNAYYIGGGLTPQTGQAGTYEISLDGLNDTALVDNFNDFIKIGLGNILVLSGLIGSLYVYYLYNKNRKNNIFKQSVN